MTSRGLPLQVAAGSPAPPGLLDAVGAAVACPDRKVIAIEGDGSGMYTLQALWTMARESLPVVVVIFANRAYRILQGELQGVGARISGQRAADMLTNTVVQVISVRAAPGKRGNTCSSMESMDCFQ